MDSVESHDARGNSGNDAETDGAESAKHGRSTSSK